MADGIFVVIHKTYCYWLHLLECLWIYLICSTLLLLLYLQNAAIKIHHDDVWLIRLSCFAFIVANYRNCTSTSGPNHDHTVIIALFCHILYWWLVSQLPGVLSSFPWLPWLTVVSPWRMDHRQRRLKLLPQQLHQDWIVQVLLCLLKHVWDLHINKLENHAILLT